MGGDRRRAPIERARTDPLPVRNYSLSGSGLRRMIGLKRIVIGNWNIESLLQHVQHGRDWLEVMDVAMLPSEATEPRDIGRARML